MIITSPENRIYRSCLQLTRKKYRDQRGEYMVEGRKLVEEAFRENVLSVIVMREDYQGRKEFGACRTLFAAKDLFDRLSQTETSQGIIGVAEKRDMDSRSFVKAVSSGGNILILDRLQDPGNIGTIIRTADAAGYAGVLTVKGTGDIYSPKAVRAAAGSIVRLPFFLARDGREAAELAAAGGKRLICTSPAAETDLMDADLSGGIALVIGNEGSGTSDYFLDRSDETVRIPMNRRVDSLNAAVAAGIFIYQSVKDQWEKGR